MRMTRSSDYMLRLVLYLACRAPGVVVARREIVDAMDIPDAFFRKIATQLGKAGILRITQGVQGGCALAVAPEKLTLLDVIEADMGEIFLNQCVLYPDSCHRSPGCSVHEVWARLRDRVRDTLREVTFADLAKREARIGKKVAKSKRRRSPSGRPARKAART